MEVRRPNQKQRAIIIVLDSLGIGSSKDSVHYGDEGADTLGHIAELCAAGKANGSCRSQSGPLHIPNLARLGLAEAAKESRGKPLPHSCKSNVIDGVFGYAQEISSGKDTPSGHWEICGLPVLFDWGVFPNTPNCFPKSLLEEIISKANIPGCLANCHASGTKVLVDFGEEHMKTGKPIFYTSSDSVFQIAAHEKTFGLEKLYDLCEIVRKTIDPLNIGRVIARPFLGDSASNFFRTSNRLDLTTPPHEPTLLDHVSEAGLPVISIGKISDIFAGKGISKSVKAPNNDEIINQILDQMKVVHEGLIFANLVDFDSKFGHRRDVSGYANAIEEFDKRLPEILKLTGDNDLLLITADHGCDPTWKGTDHTREHVPALFYSKKVSSKNLGFLTTFADMGATISHHLKTPALKKGVVCNLW